MSALPVARLALLVTALAAACSEPRKATPDSGVVGVDAGPQICGDLPAGIAQGSLGSGVDRIVSAQQRLVLMGGGSEVDAASRLFVEAANGGDVLVLRATGSLDSYTSYFHQDLACDPAPASTVTLRTDVVADAADPAVLCRVAQAEAIWLAGGDQWDYLGRWPTALQLALATAAARSAFGGTSAGAMALGEVAFDAQFDTVDSATALADPLAAAVSVRRSPFARAELAGTLVDTHFTQRDREGRLLVFAARALALLGTQEVVAIGLDESAALVISGDRFEVLTASDSDVWCYRVTGPVQLAAGSPLDLAGVQRMRVGSGEQGAWPVDFTAWSTTALEVVDGVVHVR